MSQTNQAISLEVLWNETQRLNEALAALQKQQKQQLRAVEKDGQRSASPGQDLPGRDLSGDFSEDSDVWNVWPYIWAKNLQSYCVACLHSFHGNLLDKRLARHNQQARGALEQGAPQTEVTLRLI